MNKVKTISQAISNISAGSSLAFGGNTIHRVPITAVKELIVQEKIVHVIKSAGSLEVDALCAAGLAKEVTFAYVGYENFGPAPFFCRAAEDGQAILHEHTFPSLVAGLRAAAYGLSFMPLSLLGGSQIPQANRWQTIRDPYTADEYIAVPAIRPDWAIIHVQQADMSGNARIYGSKFEDVLLSRAAKRIIITCEELLPNYALTDLPEVTDIPGFLVDAVVYTPRGAWPTSCYQHYFFSEDTIRTIVTMEHKEQLINLLFSLPTSAESPLLNTTLAKNHLGKEDNA